MPGTAVKFLRDAWPQIAAMALTLGGLMLAVDRLEKMTTPSPAAEGDGPSAMSRCPACPAGRTGALPPEDR